MNHVFLTCYIIFCVKSDRHVFYIVYVAIICRMCLMSLLVSIVILQTTQIPSNYDAQIPCEQAN